MSRNINRIAWLLFAMLPQWGWAATIHVAKTGSDSNPGTAVSPYLTINQAAQAAVAGDTVIVHEGVYREYINPKRGGTAENNRITYKAADGEQVVIKGSERITTWVEETDPAFQSGVWKVDLPADGFPDNFNPYTHTQGENNQWIVGGANVHCGDVYINGEGLKEHVTKDQKDGEPAPPEAQPWEITNGKWFTSTSNGTTTIWVHMGSLNPNEELVEINWRKAVFAPSSRTIDYITISGFTMMHSAEGPGSGVSGIIVPNCGQYWIIENNHLSYARRFAISLQRGVSWDSLGNHLIRNNVIEKCGMCGIHSYGGAHFSVIDRNIILDNNFRKEFGEFTTSSIKVLNSVDLVISRNIIINNVGGTANYGIWIDAANQNTRITGNFIQTKKPPIFFEISHGPFLVDNNVLIQDSDGVGSIQCIGANGLVTANNLLYHINITSRGDDRGQNYFHPHTYNSAGNSDFKYDFWFRAFNNLSIGADLAYKFDASEVDGNVLLGTNGTAQLYEVYLPDHVPNFSYNVEDDGLSIDFDVPSEVLGNFASTVSTESIGDIPLPNGYTLKIENSDGSAITVNKDFYGADRDGTPTPGPFENLQAGANSFLIPYFDTNTAPVITSTSLPNANPGVPYSAGIKVSGGNVSFTWMVKSGSLPPGLLLDNGILMGTPTSEGAYTFTIEVTDFDNDTTEYTFGMFVGDPGEVYTLTVNSGSGDGTYATGTVVNISADAAPAGQVFQAWTGDVAGVADVNLANTTVTMPASNITLTANYVGAVTKTIFSDDFEDDTPLNTTNAGLGIRPDVDGAGEDTDDVGAGYANLFGDYEIRVNPEANGNTSSHVLFMNQIGTGVQDPQYVDGLFGGSYPIDGMEVRFDFYNTYLYGTSLVDDDAVRLYLVGTDDTSVNAEIRLDRDGSFFIDGNAVNGATPVTNAWQRFSGTFKATATPGLVNLEWTLENLETSSNASGTNSVNLNDGNWSANLLDSTVANGVRLYVFDKKNNEDYLAYFDNVRVSARVPLMDPYDIWAAAYGGEVLIGTSTNDFDGDGEVNLVEYALAGNPTNEFDVGEMPELLNAGGLLMYIHPRRSDDPSLVYSVESCTNLVSGGWTDAGYAITGTNVTGSSLDYVTNAVPTDHNQTYLHLKVSR